MKVNSRQTNRVSVLERRHAREIFDLSSQRFRLTIEAEQRFAVRCSVSSTSKSLRKQAALFGHSGFRRGKPRSALNQA